MDFLRIIRSLEELLYEVMTWLVFYPRTMWRIVARPAEMMRYSDAEQTDSPDEQYTDTLSPPLFLMLTILLAHGVSIAIGAKRVVGTTVLGRELFESEQNLLIFRLLFFSVFALVGALAVVKRRGRALDRRTLRGPFYSQCYLTAPFALVVSGAASTVGLAWPWAGTTAAVLALTGLGWYSWVQTAWFRMELGVGIARASGLALWTVTKALVIGIGVLVLLARLLL